MSLSFYVSILFSDAIVPVFLCSPGIATSPFVLERVFCAGNESGLLDCRHERPSARGCRKRDDAGVSCFGTREFHFKFSN